MAGKVVDALSASFSEYEILEGDDDKLRTVVAASSQRIPWIDPSKLKLRHRIGRGPFGDVWLATYHSSTADYDQSYEVVIKMLHAIKQDDMRTLLDKFDDLYSKCQGVNNICYLQGTSVINGKICIIMKFYEGSIGDKMTRLKGGKLSLPCVLRYGTNLAQGISELHSKGILVLNLKPFNFLLNGTDQAVLGDIGIPYLLLGIRLPSSDMAHRLGTPNYMAPEQWQPETRGPISFETDSWGFACSIVEMLTGIVPWSGKSADEIYDLVVRKQEKPLIPSGLPPPVEKVLIGCFEYDFRSRPLMKHILEVFNSNHILSSEIGGEDDLQWTGLGSTTVSDNLSSFTGYTGWFLSKDRLQVGDIVRSRKPPNSCKPENMNVPEGTVVGLEHITDHDGFALVRVHGIHDPIRVHFSTLERVTLGLAAGDWIRLKEEDKRHSPVGILHSIDRDGSIAVGFIGLETLWKGNSSEFQMAESYCVGQFVRLKSNVLSPRFDWPRKRGGIWATGKICWILPNGCLVVKFPGRLTIGEEVGKFLADPAEVEVVSFNNCPGLVKKYQHLEDFHWAVRPFLVALGLLTAMKVGFFVGKRISKSKVKRQSSVIQSDFQHMDGQTAGNPAWLPPPVANILFREGAAR
ncbi:PREDICTED: E3 ubiquitin-protein ligase KEG isoform X1 [Theobroma cacao]|uniref:E3 ubiquitin-protein ligase KEG isoform X1 n=1 Tax=Theobroma cacao TaxID=3641 RepID=A0AB32WWC6_THECC|nr:PREDICTED: E3 ubiquitin-protein ligase KEG isoform X1 [Theobroma cacao]XP_017982681.1 PREDICTED: E3 ubiquitin-protein ligase KEG isoform X1 [Theobroma cacao]